MLRPGTVALVVLLLNWTPGPWARSQVDRGQPPEWVPIASLIQVIASPERFDGQRIRVKGYLDRNGADEALGIYVSETDGLNYVFPNSVDVHVEGSAARALLGKYVMFSGLYHAPESRAGNNGYFDQVRELELPVLLWKTRSGARQ
jgi:hypothetical protein